MKSPKPLRGLKKLAVAGMMIVALPFSMGGCNLENFTTTTTVTLSGREVVNYLVQMLVLTPIQTAIDDGVNYLFDKFTDEED
ncbi:MAG: hypothetical protein ABIG44_18445 [Planctomycetota bacterium]